MAYTETTVHGRNQQYWFPAPLADYQQNPATAPSEPTPALSRMVGVDGRYRGQLRRFPGFYTDSDWVIPANGVWRYYRKAIDSSALDPAEYTVDKALTLGGVGGTTYFKYFAIQEDAHSDGILRGWLFLANYPDDFTEWFNDLACAWTTPLVITSSSGRFTKGMVGKALVVRNISGVTLGDFVDTNATIVSVDSATQVTVLQTPLVDDVPPPTNGTKGYGYIRGIQRDCLAARYYNTRTATWYTEILCDLGTPVMPRCGGKLLPYLATYNAVDVTDLFGSATALFTYLMDASTDKVVNTSWDLVVWDDSVKATWENIAQIQKIALVDPPSDRIFTQGNLFEGLTQVSPDTSFQMRPRPYYYWAKEIDTTILGHTLYVVGSLASTPGDVSTVEYQLRCFKNYTNSAGAVAAVGATNTNLFVYEFGNPVVNPIDFQFGVSPKLSDIGWDWTLWNNTTAAGNPRMISNVPPTSQASSNLYPGVESPWAADALPAKTDLRSISAPKWLRSPIYPGRIQTVVGDEKWLYYDLTNSGFASYRDATNGKLTGNSLYTVAYRLLAPEQNWYSSLAALTTITTSQTTSETDLLINSTVVWPAKFHNLHTRRIVQAYRSTKSAVVPGTSTPSGLLFLEKEFELTTNTNTAESTKYSTTIQWGTIADEGLILLSSLDAEEIQAVRRLPGAKRIAEYEDVLFLVTVPAADDDSVDIDTLRWSSTSFDRANYFPVYNRRTLSDMSSEIEALVEAGGFLAVVCTGRLIRIHRSGTKLAVDTIHNRHGVAGRYGVIGVGSVVYMVSRAGLLACDLKTGDLQVIGVVQRIFDTQWRDSLDVVQAAYDSTMGALVLLNPTRKESLFVYMNEGVVSELWYTPWAAVTTGSDPETGGDSRAWFLDSPGRIISRVDTDAQAPSHTMLGGPASVTYNYFAPLNSSNTETFWYNQSMTNAIAGTFVGMPVVLQHTGGTRDVTYISGTTFINSTHRRFIVSPSASTIPLVTTQVSLAPIVFDLVLPPLTHHPDMPVIDMFRVKKTTAMASAWQDFSGTGGTGITYHLYNSSITTPLTSVAGNMSTDPADTYSYIPWSGTTLIPGLSVHSSDKTFGLLGVSVERTIEPSKIT